MISIIMPAYNAEKYIAAAITSVLEQSFEDWELIVVDDGSTDNTLKVAQSFESEKVKVFTKKNAGASAARNFGFFHSKGNWIKFFDADDLLSSNMLLEQINALSEHHDIAVSSWKRFSDMPLAELPTKRPEFQFLKPSEYHVQNYDSKGQKMMQPGMFLIPRQIITTRGLWNESLSLIDDYEFFTRIIFGAKKIVSSSEAILFYRSGITGSLSGKKSITAYESAWHALNLSNQILEEEGLPPLYLANLCQTFFYEFYPLTPSILRKTKELIRKFGGSDLKAPGSPKLLFLTKFMGWENAKKVSNTIQYLLKH